MRWSLCVGLLRRYVTTGSSLHYHGALLSPRLCVIGRPPLVLLRHLSTEPPPADDAPSPPPPPPAAAPSAKSSLGRNKRMTRARFGSSDESSMFAVEVPELFPVVPVLAVRKHPLFPRFVKVIEISDPDMRDLITRKIHLKQPYIGVFLRKDDSELSEVVSCAGDVHDVGTFCFIHEVEELPGDVMRLVVGSVRRIRYLGPAAGEKEDGEEEGEPTQQQQQQQQQQLPDNKKCLLWETSNVESDKFELSDEIRALSAEVIHCAREIMSHNPMYRDLFSISAIRSETFADDPARLADLGAVLSTAAASAELQEVMIEVDVKKRLLLSLSLLKKEIELLNLQQKISHEVEAKVKAQNRKHMLMEQMRIIKQELGLEKDDKAVVVERFRKRLETAGPPPPAHVSAVIEEEFNRLEHLDAQSAEFNVTRTYLDWLTCLPWGRSTAEQLDVVAAQRVLDDDHYGMVDVKKRILEFIAVSKLRNKAQGKIMCFVGPPGVGKTSIARSIARALNREYFRFSVGGLVDVAEIKGHRRTYVGAMPGKMVQCLKKVQTDNPLVLIDEIDKMGGRGAGGGGGGGHSIGDPSSALLEMLDPEQNAHFLDHYLDVTVDVSKVLFVCTANLMDTVPEALRDRMEEKLAIARQYLIPREERECGVAAEAIGIDDAVIDLINRHYCRESGVRSLQKQIERIFRKVALEIVSCGGGDEGGAAPAAAKRERRLISADNLAEYLGKPVFVHDRMYESTPVGVVAGLAWTALGGSVLYVEAAAVPNGGKAAAPSSAAVIITGNMGDVMKESVHIALTYAKNYLQHQHQRSSSSSSSSQVLTDGQIHIHVPEGASPKDGPSAGCTLVTSMVSLALGIPVRANLAMTGEVSLKGNILPVGGIKEKVIAAKRAAINDIVMPADNRKDFEELPDFIRKDVRVHYVQNYPDIFKLVF